MLIPLVEQISQSTAHTFMVCGYPRLHSGDTTQPEVAGGTWGIPHRDTLRVIVPRRQPGGCMAYVMSTCFSLVSAPNDVMFVPWGHHVHVVAQQTQNLIQGATIKSPGGGGDDVFYYLFQPGSMAR